MNEDDKKELLEEFKKGDWPYGRYGGDHLNFNEIRQDHYSINVRVVTKEI